MGHQPAQGHDLRAKGAETFDKDDGVEEVGGNGGTIPANLLARTKGIGGEKLSGGWELDVMCCVDCNSCVIVNINNGVAMRGGVSGTPGCGFDLSAPRMSVFHGLVAPWCLAVCHPVLSDETQLNLPGCNADWQTDCVAHLFPKRRNARTAFVVSPVAISNFGTNPPTQNRRMDAPTRYSASVAQGQNFAYEQVRGVAAFRLIFSSRWLLFFCLDPNPDDKFRHCAMSGVPNSGVALEGGGSKTAPFALGVLAKG